MQVWSLGQADPLEEGMATHCSILAWKIPWTEEPGGLQSLGSQRVRHDWSDLARTSMFSLEWKEGMFYPKVPEQWGRRNPKWERLKEIQKLRKENCPSCQLSISISSPLGLDLWTRYPFPHSQKTACPRLPMTVSSSKSITQPRPS